MNAAASLILRISSAVVALSATIPKVSAERYKVTPADYVDWVDRNRVCGQLAAYTSWDARLTDPRGSQDPSGHLPPLPRRTAR